MKQLQPLKGEPHKMYMVLANLELYFLSLSSLVSRYKYASTSSQRKTEWNAELGILKRASHFLSFSTSLNPSETVLNSFTRILKGKRLLTFISKAKMLTKIVALDCLIWSFGSVSFRLFMLFFTLKMKVMGISIHVWLSQCYELCNFPPCNHVSVYYTVLQLYLG